MVEESEAKSSVWLLDWAKQHRAWLLVGLTLLFVAAVRFHLRSMPLERDEGEYAYAGQLILEGQPPYRDVYNMKLPGTYAGYAVIMALFGQTASGIHFGVMLVNLASIVLVFLIGKRLLDETTGIVAAASFALMSLSSSVFGLAGHATHFVTVFALGGILVLLRAEAEAASGRDRSSAERERDYGYGRRATRSSSLFARQSVMIGLSGLLFGLALLMKQHGVFFGIFGGVYLLWSRQGRRSRDGGIRLQELSFFSAAFVLPYLLTCLLLWGMGVFHQFYFWTVSYAGKYASYVPASYALESFRHGLNSVVGPNLLLWLLPWVGLWSLWWDAMLQDAGSGRKGKTLSPFQVQRPGFFFLTLLAAGFASVSVGFHFREHYFITLLPVLSLLTGVAVSRGWQLLKRGRGSGLARNEPGLGGLALALGTAIVGVFGVGLAASTIGNAWVWFAAPAKAEWNVYGTKLYTEAVSVADYIKSRSAKDARVAVIGSEPEIYFLANRRSATGYIYTYPLVENQPYALKMQQEMIDEIERSRPEYVVYVQDSLSWLSRRGSPRDIFEWWEKYWAANLELVNTVKIEQMGDDPNAGDTGRYLLLLKRKGN